MIELPLEITEEDTFKTLFTKFGAYALDKQENLSNIIGDMLVTFHGHGIMMN